LDFGDSADRLDVQAEDADLARHGLARPLVN
jgi:hypothetical protein